jgi:hypothetical protein
MPPAVKFADDSLERPVGLPGETDVVARRADVLAPDDDLGPLLPRVTAVSVQHLRLIMHLGVPVANLGERRCQQAGIPQRGTHPGEM